MLEKQRHEIVLKRILADLYEQADVSSLLGFKGGTCLYFFHDLDRFSVDLDFTIIKTQEIFNPETITSILQKHITIEEVREKYATWFWLGSYEKGFHKIKIEVSKRNYPDTFETKDWYGLSIPCMVPASMFAHKLCAITDRPKLQNRDLYDSWFMFDRNFPIDENIVKLRTNKTLTEYFHYLIEFIPGHINNSHILMGLGEVLSEPQKQWVKDHMLRKLLFELKIRTEK